MRLEYCFSINISKMVYRSMAVRSRQFWEHSANQKELAVIPYVEKGILASSFGVGLFRNPADLHLFLLRFCVMV